MHVLLALILFCSPFLFIRLAYLRYGRSGILAFVQNKIVQHSSISREEYVRIDTFLSQKNTFYKQLSIGAKARFIKRLRHFIKIKSFEGRKGLKVTYEMKLLVASSGVQLTFGLNHFTIDNLKGFVIYPSIFYNSIIKHHLKGGMPPEGKMMLSWEHVQHGFYYPKDKYNLAMHEMAHALKLSIKHAYDFDFHFYSYLKDWNKYSKKVFANMKFSNEHFLRSYAATNMEEFFAVSVEHFFEAPKEFRKELPRLYDHLSKMLNLDPVNYSDNYRLTMNN